MNHNRKEYEKYMCIIESLFCMAEIKHNVVSYYLIQLKMNHSRQ